MITADRLSDVLLALCCTQRYDTLESLILQVSIVLLFHEHVRRVNELDVAIAFASIDAELGGLTCREVLGIDVTNALGVCHVEPCATCHSDI